MVSAIIHSITVTSKTNTQHCYFLTDAYYQNIHLHEPQGQKDQKSSTVADVSRLPSTVSFY